MAPESSLPGIPARVSLKAFLLGVLLASLVGRRHLEQPVTEVQHHTSYKRMNQMFFASRRCRSSPKKVVAIT
jgi:hypothetical protein